MGISDEVILDSKLYFSELIDKACLQRNIKPRPLVQEYLVNLLNSFLRTENLYQAEKENGKKENLSLAELYLKAVNAEDRVKINLLKRLGDTSLYISGFFGDSFKRKIIDVDYYMEMGETAYGVLSESIDLDLQARVYKEISSQFTQYVDVLTVISQDCFIQDNKDILRLYDRYSLTRSDLAKEQLIDLGVLNIPEGKINKQ